MIKRPIHWGVALLLACVPAISWAADPPGLVTVPSKYSVEDTIRRFEEAVTAAGWIVFARLDHAAAAEKYKQKLLPRTVIVYGNPGLGTANMVTAPTLAIDIPPKALVWQDDQGKVWLSYNSAAYLSETIYARHGVKPLSPERLEASTKFLKETAQKATEQPIYGKHMPMVYALKNVKKIEVARARPRPNGEPPAYYLVTELWFDSPEVFSAVAATPEWKAMSADVANFAPPGKATVVVSSVEPKR